MSWQYENEENKPAQSIYSTIYYTVDKQSEHQIEKNQQSILNSEPNNEQPVMIKEIDNDNGDNRRPDEIFRDKLWQEFYDRRLRRICNRCGSYTRYSITTERQDKSIDLYDGQDKDDFYLIKYSLDSKYIEDYDSLDDEFYDICKKCQQHILGKSTWNLPTNSAQIHSELKDKRLKEEIRRLFQKDRERKAKHRALQIRKQMAAAGIQP